MKTLYTAKQDNASHNTIIINILQSSPTRRLVYFLPFFTLRLDFLGNDATREMVLDVGSENTAFLRSVFRNFHVSEEKNAEKLEKLPVHACKIVRVSVSL